MSEENDEKIDMVSVPKKSYWHLTAPIIIFVLFNAVYGIIDLYWVSKLDSASFYAASASLPIFTLICAVGDSVGQGTNSLMSRSIGADNYENAYNTIFHGMLICLIVALLLALGIPFIDDFLIFAKLDKSVEVIVSYLAPMFLFSICFILPNFLSETLQSEGDSRRPTMIIIFCNILNLVLDPILIFNFNLGLVGAAYATIISSLVSALMLLYLYLAKKTKIPLRFKFSKLKFHIFFEILNVAFPNFIKDSLFCSMAVFVNGILLKEIGEIGVLLYSTSIKLQDLFITPIKAYGRGLMSVTGQLFGSKKILEVEDMYHYVLKIALITIIIISILFVVFRDVIYSSFSIFGMNLAVEHIAICGSVILIGMAISMITSKMIDGFGKSYYNLIFTALLVILQIVIISIIDEIFLHGTSVLIGIMIAEIISTSIYYVFLKYMFKRFEKQKKEEKLVVI